MSSEEKNQNSKNNEQTKELNNNFFPTSQINKEEEKSDNNLLIKPIPINAKLIKHQSNEITTMGNSSVKINNINPDSNIQLIYPQYQLKVPLNQNNSFENNNKLNFFQSQNSKNEENNNNQIIERENLCCSCTKTKCLKKYCECFANKQYCKDCKCQDCFNKLELNNYKSNIYLNENDVIICTCTKSNCNKKYCECYKAGIKCNEKCRCLNCMNTTNTSQNIINNSINNIDNNNNNKNSDYNHKNNKNINLDEKKQISRNSSSSGNLNEQFKIQRISVYINKNQTMINVEKFSKAEMNILGKKRNHD